MPVLFPEITKDKKKHNGPGHKNIKGNSPVKQKEQYQGKHKAYNHWAPQ